jgi:murein DD-endopeptidase MepM/ murein hydrolase activator NlpD
MFRMTSHVSRPPIASVITMLLLCSLAARAPSEAQEPYAPTRAQAAVATERQRPVDPIMVGPVVWSVLAVPIHPVEGTDGRIHLVYELHVSNVSHFDVRIKSIEVLDAHDNHPTGVSRVFSADGQDVTGKVRPFSLPQPTQEAADYTDQLGPGHGGVVYFDITYGAWRDVPRSLKHRIIVSAPSSEFSPFTVIDAGTDVSRQAALAIAPPLQGDKWLIANGSGAIVTAHRYTVQATNGRLRPPEHFAIDFIRLDANGRAYVGDLANVHNWFGYGSEIISATHGKVVEVLDNLDNQTPGQPLSPLTPDQFAGNHVIVEIGAGISALYAHMAPGSIVVSEGDAVRPGQVLGRLGNSGSTDGPHLHFQIMDSASALNTNGLPFVFDQMTYQGQLVGTLDSVGNTVFSGQAPTIDMRDAGPRMRQMPLTLDLIGFR